MVLGFAKYRTFFNTGFRYCNNFNTGITGNTGTWDITKYVYSGFLLGPSPRGGVQGGGVSDFCRAPPYRRKFSSRTDNFAQNCLKNINFPKFFLKMAPSVPIYHCIVSKHYGMSNFFVSPPPMLSAKFGFVPFFKCYTPTHLSFIAFQRYF